MKKNASAAFESLENFINIALPDSKIKKMR